MSPEFLEKWEHILEDVEKNRIPVQFIKKLIIKKVGKKQHTINIQNLLKQGLKPEEIEEVVTGVEFILNVQSIADTVQPETDRLLGKL
jgi:hypothetical protein